MVQLLLVGGTDTSISKVIYNNLWFSWVVVQTPCPPLDLRMFKCHAQVSWSCDKFYNLRCPELPFLLLARVTRQTRPVNKKKCVKLRLFSYPPVYTCALGAQKNRLIATVLLSIHNICFGWVIRKIIFSYALLSGGLVSLICSRLLVHFLLLVCSFSLSYSFCSFCSLAFLPFLSQFLLLFFFFWLFDVHFWPLHKHLDLFWPVSHLQTLK